MKKTYVSPTTTLLELAVQHMLAASFTDGNIGSGGVGHNDATLGGTFGDAPAFDSNFMDEE